VLSGWLHRAAQNIAAQTVRSDVRRRAREQEAAAMNELHEADAVWEHVAPHLDNALGALSEADRDALLLRYFEGKSAREMAQTLGTSEDAAQKRVSRAVDRLRECLAKRGVTAGASGLVVVISANAVQSAPVGLAVTISTAAALAGTTFTTTASATATQAIAMTTLQKTLIAATLSAAIGTGIYEARQALNLRTQVQTLQQQQAPLAGQVQQLANERGDATRQLTALREDNARLNRNTAELLKLRGEVGTLRRALTEASRPATGNQTPSAAQNRDDDIHPIAVPSALTTDLNPVTRIDAPFEISQLKDVGNASIEAAGQTVLWSVFNRDEQGFDRIRYRAPETPQLTAKGVQQLLEVLANRFAGAANVTIAFWSRDGDNRRLVKFSAAWPDPTPDKPEGGTLVFQRTETGWYLDQFVVQGGFLKG